MCRKFTFKEADWFLDLLEIGLPICQSIKLNEANRFKSFAFSVITLLLREKVLEVKHFILGKC